MAATTLGGVLNAGLKVIREPEVTEITAGNILQQHLIECINAAVVDIREDGDYPWTYAYATLVTTAEVDEEYAAVTTGSTTVTSVDEDGVVASDFTGITVNMWFRAAADNVSYGIASAEDATLVLDTAYVGTTSTAGGYRAFQDTYALTTSDLDTIVALTMGDATTWMGAIGGVDADRRLRSVSMQSLLETSGGDLHSEATGRPRTYTRLRPNASDEPQIILWPAPDSQYLLNVWYTTLYSDASAFDTTLLGADAPASVYVALEHKCRAAARMWDRDMNGAAYWEAMYQKAKADLHRRENREADDRAISVATGRRAYTRYPINYGEVFDRRSARRY